MRSHKSRTAALALLAALGAAAAAQAQSGRDAERPYTTWRTYGGGGHSSQYSALDEINKSNVAQLEVAWSFPVGERSFCRSTSCSASGKYGLMSAAVNICRANGAGLVGNG